MGYTYIKSRENRLNIVAIFHVNPKRGELKIWASLGQVLNFLKFFYNYIAPVELWGAIGSKVTRGHTYLMGSLWVLENYHWNSHHTMWDMKWHTFPLWRPLLPPPSPPTKNCHGNISQTSECFSKSQLLASSLSCIAFIKWQVVLTMNNVINIKLNQNKNSLLYNIHCY